MKKILLIFFCLMFCITSCIWFYDNGPSSYRAKFFIKNNTEESIEIWCNDNPECLTVAPEDSVSIGLVDTKASEGYPAFRPTLQETGVETVSAGKNGTVLRGVFDIFPEDLQADI